MNSCWGGGRDMPPIFFPRKISAFFLYVVHFKYGIFSIEIEDLSKCSSFLVE